MARKKISDLWQDPGFRSLSVNTKFVYLYLRTRPDLNTLGLFVSGFYTIAEDTGLSMQEMEMSCLDLYYDKLLHIFELGKDRYAFFLPDIVDNLPKKGPTLEKAARELEALPDDIRESLKGRGLYPDIKIPEDGKPPTALEVTTYGLDHGYVVDGVAFVNYYESLNWKDSRGKKIRDWKAKCRRVWFKSDNKIEPNKDAPKGCEYFYVIDNDGQVIHPKGWRNGKPYGNNVIEDTLLIQEFQK